MRDDLQRAEYIFLSFAHEKAHGLKNLMRSLEPRPPTVKRKGNVRLTEGDLGRRLFEKASIKTTKVDYKKNTSIMTNLTYICVRVMAMLAGKISCANLSGLYALNDH